MKGKVLNASNKLPINEVQISSVDAASTVLTNEKGEFSIQVSDPRAILLFKGIGYLEKEEALRDVLH